MDRLRQRKDLSGGDQTLEHFLISREDLSVCWRVRRDFGRDKRCSLSGRNPGKRSHDLLESETALTVKLNGAL